MPEVRTLRGPLLGAAILLLLPGASSGSTDGSSRAAAAEAARASQHRVEVSQLRTETGQTFANPDGTFTAIEHVTPVRARTSHGWEAIDTTLALRADGTVAPQAAAVQLAFSGGGADPLVRMKDGDRELVLRWPTSLPKPTLRGDEAFYREALRGVDLHLRATATGFAPVLVVKNRTAARDPRVRNLRFGLSTRGVNVRRTRRGVGAYDRDGELAFGSGVPAMWDSTRPAGAAAPFGVATTALLEAEEPRHVLAPTDASRTAEGQIVVAGNEMSVVPDQQLLTADSTAYPVSVGVAWNAGQTGWTSVFRQYPGMSYWNGANLGSDGRARVGYTSWDRPIVTVRSFFQFDVSRAWGKHVLSAEFNAFNSWSSSCARRGVWLRHVGEIGPWTTWNSQPWEGAELGGHDVRFGRPDCPGNWLGWNVSGPAAWSAERRIPLTLRLMADEGDTYAWRKFDTNPTLVYTYNTVPNGPGSLTAENKACGQAPNEPYTHKTEFTMRATVTDDDGGSVAAHFEWLTREGSVIGGTMTPGQPSGTTFAATVPAGVYMNGSVASFRVRGWDGTDWGPWGPTCDVTIDQRAPAEPDVSSMKYPENERGGAVGSTGEFAFGANGLRLGFEGAHWIWLDEPGGPHYPVATRSFHRTVELPTDRRITSATMVATADDEFQLYVNGTRMTSSLHWNDPRRVDVTDVLHGGRNDLAIAVHNRGREAGLVAVLRVQFETGEPLIVVTDRTWRSSPAQPTGWTQPGFDASAWTPSLEQARYGSPPWATPSFANDRLGFEGAHWVWLDEPGGPHYPVATRSFHRTVELPTDRRITSATMVATADDEFQLYVNGTRTTSSVSWHEPRRVDVTDVLHSGRNDLAIAVHNGGGQAGLLALLRVEFDTGEPLIVATDRTWRSSSAQPAGWTQPGFDASAWTPAREQGAYGAAPWGTVTVPGDDVVGFLYDLDNDDPKTFVAADTAGGSAKVLITPPEDGPMDLYVRSVDRAGNLGATYRYHFFVGAPSGPRGHWRLEGVDESTVTDSSGNGHDGTIVGSQVRWQAGRDGNALRLDGGTGHVTTTGGATVATDRTFSVAAWVNLDSASISQTAVSQDGPLASGFALQYRGSTGKWAFAVAPTDEASPAWIFAESPSPAQAGRWTHLVGVYDAAVPETRLYVDGVLVGRRPGRVTQNVVGAVQLGRMKLAGTSIGHWGGALDDVRVYDRALGLDQVRELATRPANEELFLPFDEGTGSTAGDVSGNYRTAMLGPDATWTAGVVGPGAVDVRARPAASASVPAVRTDSSFTVTAYARHEQSLTPPGTGTVVSQDGPLASGFALQRVIGPDGRGFWRFSLSPLDAARPSYLFAQAPDPAISGRWTHLAGVYDAAAGELRLHVDGALVATAPARASANVAGNVAIGRAKKDGGMSDYWSGATDDVHVWTGVRTAQEIQDEFNDPVTRRSTAYTGQLGVFVRGDGERFSTTGPVPPGYHFESPLGLPAPGGTAATRIAYSCLHDGDEYTSLRADCEGDRLLHVLGPLYTSPPADVPTLPVYRCASATDRFDSGDAGCGGHANEGLLGYTRAYAHLIGSTSRGAPWDRTSSTERVPAFYEPELNLGIVALTEQAGTTALYRCAHGTDTFASTDPDCEGIGQRVQRLGWVWSDPPPHARASRELFRCSAGSDRFESLDPTCSDEAFDRSLGFVVHEL